MKLEMIQIYASTEEARMNYLIINHRFRWGIAICNKIMMMALHQENLGLI